MDLLDFYRGTLSVRRLIILIRHLPADSALARALNDNHAPWSTTDHLLADLWILILQVFTKSRLADHPVRAEMQAKARSAAQAAKVAGLRSLYMQRKRKRTKELG